MKTTKEPTIFSDKSLNPEFKRALKSALSFKATMPIQKSEIDEFFDEKDYQAIKINYSDMALKDVRSIIKARIKNKDKVLVVLNGSKRTTFDHLNSIWTSISKKVGDTSWGYYLNEKASNSLYLFVK